MHLHDQLPKNNKINDIEIKRENPQQKLRNARLKSETE